MSAECDGCKWWSEMIAKNRGEHVVALCLNPASPKSQQYTRRGCECYIEGTPIDDPETIF